MFWFGGKKKKDNQSITAKKSKKAKLTACYETNLTCLKAIFQDDDPIQFREFKSSNNNKIRFCVIYCDGLADSAIIDEHIIKPVMLDYIPDDTKIIDSLIMQVIQTDSAKKSQLFSGNY